MKKVLLTLAFALLAVTSAFATTSITSTPVQHFVDNNGIALSGGKLFTYNAGTTTKVTTYTDSTGGTPNANPIILNSRGEANIWLTPGLTYKFVLAPSTDTDPPTDPIWTVDNIPAATAVGTLATQNANAVAITGGTITGVTLGPSTVSVVNMASGGTGTGSQCYSVSTPCGNLNDAITAAAPLISNGNDITIQVNGGGTFVGGSIHAAVNNRFTFDAAGSTGRGPMVKIIGPATFTQPATSTAVFNIFSASVYFKNVTIQAANSTLNAAVNTDFASHVILDDVTIDSQNFDTADAIAVDAARGSIVEIDNTFTLKNAWLYAFEGEVGGYFYVSGTITCDASFSTTYYWVLEASHVHTVSPAGYSGCSSASGTVGIYAIGNSSFRRWTSTYDVPGFEYRINNKDIWTNGNVYVPTLGTCTNGTFTGFTQGDNYDGYIALSGANSSCQLVFGKPTTANNYWESSPICTAQSTQAIALAVTADTIKMTVTPASALGAGSIFYHCRARDQG